MAVLNNKDGFTPPLTDYDILCDMLDTLIHSKYSGYFVLKGGFALSAYLENNNLDYFDRKTTDLDLVFSSKEIWREFVNECGALFSTHSKFGLSFNLTGRIGQHHSWENGRLFFTVTDKDGLLYHPGIDMSIEELPEAQSLYLPGTKILITSVSLETMLSDKLDALTKPKLLSRPWDIYDVFILSNLKDYMLDVFMDYWEDTGNVIRPGIPIYILDAGNWGGLRISYNNSLYKYNFDIEFCDLIRKVISFISPLYEYLLSKRKLVAVWSRERWAWK